MSETSGAASEVLQWIIGVPSAVTVGGMFLGAMSSINPAAAETGKAALSGAQILEIFSLIVAIFILLIAGYRFLNGSSAYQ